MNAVKKLVALGADVNKLDTRVRSPFSYIAPAQSEEMINAFLEGNPTLLTLRQVEQEIKENLGKPWWFKKHPAHTLAMVQARIQELFAEPSVPTETIPEI